jgi:uncharacterized membrane protein
MAFPLNADRIKMKNLATGAADRGAAQPDDYHRAMKKWFILGWPAFLSLIVIFVPIVMKPDLW